MVGLYERHRAMKSWVLRYIISKSSIGSHGISWLYGASDCSAYSFRS